MMVQDPPRGRMKILTGIQKQNNHLSLVFCEGERWERGPCFDRSCSHHAGIHRVNNVGKKSSCYAFRCSCEHSLDVFRQKAKANSSSERCEDVSSEGNNCWQVVSLKV